MNISLAITTSLLILGVFTFNISSTFGQIIPSQQQSLSQPCEDNGHAVLGTGKQILKQSNRCVIIENNVPTNGVCGTNAILQNGVCVPTTTSPVANAGQDQTVPQGSTVTLDGTGSFARGGATIVSYSWVQTSEPFVTLNGPNTATPTFQAPTVSTSISLTFSLRVTDSNGLVSAPDSVTINVHP